MRELNSLFRKRICISEDEKITFGTLDNILEKTAYNIPFENLCVIENKTNDITKENLMNKILLQKEGGLCYELNSMFYLFLIENGFNASLVRGVVYNHENQRYQTIGRNHATILIIHDEQTYLIDTGFGANLPLKPVPLTGETITSTNGEFRIEKVNTEHGDYILHIKLKHKDPDWRIGYAFDSKRTVTDLLELNEIQSSISEHPESPFNKNPLITRLTSEGSITLTDSSFTQWVDGNLTKEKIDYARFKELSKQHFGI